MFCFGNLFIYHTTQPFKVYNSIIFSIFTVVQPSPQAILEHFHHPYAGQEATVRTGHGTTDWFQIGKGARQGCILSPCLFNLYTEYIMGNTGLEEAQGGIKIAWRNINNIRYADDTTLISESEEELKSLLMKVERGE